MADEHETISVKKMQRLVEALSTPDTQSMVASARQLLRDIPDEVRALVDAFGDSETQTAEGIADMTVMSTSRALRYSMDRAHTQKRTLQGLRDDDRISDAELAMVLKHQEAINSAYRHGLVLSATNILTSISIAMDPASPPERWLELVQDLLDTSGGSSRVDDLALNKPTPGCDCPACSILRDIQETTAEAPAPKNKLR